MGGPFKTRCGDVAGANRDWQFEHRFAILERLRHQHQARILPHSRESRMAKDNERFWRSMSKALGVEYRAAQTIRGTSGIDHPVQSISVDDKTKRVLVVSAEASPRMAALMQVDVQTTMPDVQVLVARPLLFDLPQIARTFTASVMSGGMSLAELGNAMASKDDKASAVLGEKLKEVINPLAETGKRIELPVASQLIGVAQELVGLNWRENLEKNPDMTGIVATLMESMAVDSGAVDRALGICPLPLYSLMDTDWEIILSEKRTDEVRQRLKDMGILQYFYPSPDHLALGLAERGLAKREDITNLVLSSNSRGHPLGESELITSAQDVRDIVESLSENNFVTEVDHTVKVTSEGTTARLKVKAAPREGVVSKFINRFKLEAKANIRISTKDLT